MRSEHRGGGRQFLFLGALAPIFGLIVIRLFGHAESVGVLLALPGPASLACAVRCLGTGAFLQVAGQAARGLLIIFLAGAFLYALVKAAVRVIRTQALMRRAEKHTVPWSGTRLSGLIENAAIFTDRRPLAFTGGFFRPRTFLSRGLVESLDDNELRAVILHEAHHKAARDPLKGLLASFLADFLFFIPISRCLKEAYLLRSEMRADLHSVDHQADPLDLAGSLLKVRKLNGLAASWFFDPTAERLKRLLGVGTTLRPPAKRIALTVAVLAVTIFLSFVPLKTSVTSMFINHHRACEMRSSPK